MGEIKGLGGCRGKLCREQGRGSQQESQPASWVSRVQAVASSQVLLPEARKQTACVIYQAGTHTQVACRLGCPLPTKGYFLITCNKRDLQEDLRGS